MKGLKNKYLKAFLCLGVGIVVLSAAVFANYDNANGYESCKTALKNMLYQTNFTMDMEASVAMDGQKLISEKNSAKVAEGQDAFYQTYGQHENLMDNSTSSYKTTCQDKVTVYEDVFTDGTTNKYMLPSHRDKNEVSFLSDDEMTGKFVNFVEVVADTMIGDLKNSFVLTSKDDNTRTYTVSLSAEQLPEIVTSGVSLAVASIKANMESNPVNGGSTSDTNQQFYANFFGGESEPYIEGGNLVITLNNDDTLASVSGDVTLCGFDANNGQHNITIQLSGNAYDYGTTAIERVDTSDAQTYGEYDETLMTYSISEDGQITTEE